MKSNSLNVANKKKLIKCLPLFSSLSDTLITALANLFRVETYPSQAVIVKEHQQIDSLYIIAEGNAEVSRQETINGKTRNEIIAVLHRGEAIGLDDKGIFSKTNLRTATVTTLTPATLLVLDLNEFKNFLTLHPDCLPDTQHATSIILRQNLIKKIEPFAEIDPHLLANVMKQVEDIDIPADTILFQQGDTADCCYLIYSGKVDVMLTKADGSTTTIASLEAGSIVGELALLTDKKRNATVRTAMPCKFLLLKQEQFQQLLELTSAKSFDAISAMMLDRYRPERCPGITIHRRNDTENKSVIILKNAELGTYFNLSEESLFIWNLLDGDHTIQDIEVAFFYQYHILVSDDIGNLILRLMHSGFVKAPTLTNYIKKEQPPLWARGFTAFRKLVLYQYAIKNVDPFITRLYEKVGYLFFTKTAHIMMMLIAIIGLCSFIGFFPHAEKILQATPNAWLLIFLMGPANIFTIPFHELAHALTTKAYGFQVHRLGVGWFWLGPIAFADTSDMWLSTRGPRIAVNLAGIYFNVVISGILSMLAWWIPYPTVAVFMWLVAFSSYLLAFYNLDPLFELDGYYVLMDALDKPNLRMHATKWLVEDFKKTWKSPKLLRQHLPEILYWITSLSFIFFAAHLAYVIQNYVLTNMLPTQIRHAQPTYFRWALTSFIIILSFASLYHKTKQYKQLSHEQ